MRMHVTKTPGTLVSKHNLPVLNSMEICELQGHPVNVKHDTRCVIGKVGGDKNPKRGKF